MLKYMKNTARTENGAVSNASTLNANLDLFGSMGAMRDRNVISLFKRAYADDKVLAVLNMFYCRNPRGGLGERKASRDMLMWLYANDRDMFDRVFSFVPQYGRWDDLFAFIDYNPVALYIFIQLTHDHSASFTSASPSLLAKWMPSESSGSGDKAREMVMALNRVGGEYTMRTYRKTLSDIRRALRIVESKMSANKWSEITYEHVPSRANVIYRKAFSRHDADRYTKFIEKAKSGATKMNASVLYPYEFAREIKSGKYDEALDALWSNLPDYLADENTQAVVAIDQSGSMYWPESKCGNVYAGDVAASLALYFADRSKGVWKNHYLTFDSNSRLLEVPKGTLEQRMRFCIANGGGGSTNVQSVFDTILATAKRYKVPESDMPGVVFIVSDMQFNPSGHDTNHNTIVRKYTEAGYKVPFLVYWQIAARKSDKPVTMYDENTMLVSGVSASIFEAALKCQGLDPYNAMLETLAPYRHILE